MARRITLLETKKESDGITVLEGTFWFEIANVNARVPRPAMVSLLLNVLPPNNVTGAEQTLLESGALREEFFRIAIASSTTLAQAKADLERRWTDRNIAVQALPATRQFYGLTYDGISWINP